MQDQGRGIWGQPRVLALAICLILFPFATINGIAATHFISTSGSDASSGTANSTPWAHLPGMSGCTGNCAAYTPSAGDIFILKGCDVWTAASLPVLWDWSGTAGNPISITVDKTWFNTTNCPSAWNR